MLNRKEFYDIDWMDNQIALSRNLVLCLRNYSIYLKKNNFSIHRKDYNDNNKKNQK